MPASRGRDRSVGARPNGPVDAAAVADWEARTYPQLARFAAPVPGDVVLDDVLPDMDEMLDDPAGAAAAIVDELGR